MRQVREQYTFWAATWQSNGRAQRQQRGGDGEMFFEATNSGLGRPIGKRQSPVRSSEWLASFDARPLAIPEIQPLKRDIQKPVLRIEDRHHRKASMGHSRTKKNRACRDNKPMPLYYRATFPGLGSWKYSALPVCRQLRSTPQV